MANNLVINDIKNKIFTIRNVQVMLDRDLAELYGVTTKQLNQQVKRNLERFPEDFMFQLTENEFDILRSQNVTANPNLAKIRFMPRAFTEQGVANLSSVLTSKKAIRINNQIMRTFVAMKRFIASNAQVFYRLDNVEHKMIDYDTKFDKIFHAIESKGIKPEKGIFFDGQVFDAHCFVSDLIRSAKESITLIDNYIDETVLTILSKRKKQVTATIQTRQISKQLKLDLEKHNQQYPKIDIRIFKHSHDRFLIIDNDVYHIGASLKDLGKKWFAFSRFDKESIGLLDRL